MSALALLVLASACTGEDHPAEPDPPTCDPVPVDEAAASPLDLDAATTWNLLLLSIDTLRKDALERGADSEQNPFLSALLDQAVVLEDFRACSNWTLASMLCVMSGRSNVALGHVPATGTTLTFQEPPGFLPALLGEAGYTTRLVSANYFLNDSSPLGSEFDEVALLHEAQADAVAAEGLAAVEALSAGEDPWFLQLHFFDPHTPYQAPASYLEALEDLDPIPWDVSLHAPIDALEQAYGDLDEATQALVRAHLDVHYRAEIAFLDTELGRLFDQLEDRGALDRTLVVLVSDHGEQFWEHGEFRHGRALHPGESDAIAAFWWPGATPRRWDGPTDQTDLVPTILAALGIPQPDHLTGTVLGQAPADAYRCALVNKQVRPPILAVDRDGLRLHYAWDGERQLFDVATDPQETTDLYGTWDFDRGCLWAALEAEVGGAAPLIDWGEPVDLVP